MSLYRCAACGSPNVKTDTQAGGVGYNYVKGAVGTVVLGVGGAAAGIESKQQQVFKCPDCGMTLTYSMPDNLKQLIDLGVMVADARSNLLLDGIRIDWNTLVAQYKNIESGAGDATLAAQKEYDINNAGFFDELIADGEAKDKAYKASSKQDEAIVHWQKAVIEAEERVKAELPAEIKKQVQVLINKYQEEKAQLEILNEKLRKFEDKLSSLGFFKRAEKAELNGKIEAVRKEIENKKQVLSTKYTKSNIQNQAEQAAKKILENKYIPKAPFNRMKWIDYIEEQYKTAAKPGQTQKFKENVELQKFIFYYLDEFGETPIDDFLVYRENPSYMPIRGKNPFFKYLPDAYIGANRLKGGAIMNLENAGLVVRTSKSDGTQVISLNL